MTLSTSLCNSLRPSRQLIATGISFLVLASGGTRALCQEGSAPLLRRTHLSGRVTDSRGRPIEWAIVDLGGRAAPTGSGSLLLVTTDSLGRFYFDSALVDGYIRVRSLGYVTQIARTALTAPAANLVIHLRRDAAFERNCRHLCDLLFHRVSAREEARRQRPRRDTSVSLETAAVYSAVVDSVYRIRGDSPRLIVIADSTQGFVSSCAHRLPCELPGHYSVLDSSLLAGFHDFILRRNRTRFADPMPAIRSAIPIVYQSDADRDEIFRLGAELGSGPYQPGGRDMEGFERAFRQLYPGAWGTLFLSRVGFDSSRTKALLQMWHRCGGDCATVEILYLRKTRGIWRVWERMRAPMYNNEWWDSAPLRYIGEDAWKEASTQKRRNEMRAARSDSIRASTLPRIVRGTVTHWQTGLPLGNAVIAVHYSPRDSIRVIRADKRGRFVVRNPPVGAIMLETRCPSNRSRHSSGLIGFSQALYAPSLYVRPAMDTIFDILVKDISPCLLRNRFHRLDVAGEMPRAYEMASDASGDIIPVYSAALGEIRRVYGDSIVTLAAGTRTGCDSDGCEDPSGRDSLVAFEHILAETAEDFVAANGAERRVLQMSRALRYRFITRGERVFFAEQARHASYYRDGEGDWLFWKAFAEGYPGSRGIASFSSVGFNHRHTEALLKIWYESPGVTASAWVVLKKRCGKWSVARPTFPRCASRNSP